MTGRRPGIVLQARLASQRLPRKALAMIAGRTILEHCLQRLLASEAAPVVLATTARTEDDTLVDLAMEVGVPAFRGDADDVLERYVQCAAHFGFDCIVRATADNPGVDVEAPGRVLDALHRVRADYVHEHGLPYGAAVEGVRTEALVRAAKLTRDVFDREHVTTFVRRRTDLFAVVQLQAPRDRARPDVRLTVDTIEDLDRVRGIYQSTTAGMPSVADFIAAADRTARQSVA